MVITLSHQVSYHIQSSVRRKRSDRLQGSRPDKSGVIIERVANGTLENDKYCMVGTLARLMHQHLFEFMDNLERLVCPLLDHRQVRVCVPTRFDFEDG